MSQELEAAAGGKSAPVIPPIDVSTSSPVASPPSSPREEVVTGGLLAGSWKFDADSNILSAFDVS